MKINKKIKRIIGIGIVLIVILLIVLQIKFFSSSVLNDGYVIIPTHATYEQVLDSIKPHVKNISDFDFMAKKRKYPQLIKPGKYKLEEGESNWSLVNKLRSGRQEEQNIVIQNYANVYLMAGKMGEVLEPDSLDFINYFNQLAKQKGLEDAEELKMYFIPNTYRMYWNTSVEKFTDRMFSEYDKFWTEARKNKAKSIGFDEIKVITLASIVQRESVKTDEQPRIAGLYINRLNSGMKLQSDPTVIYALKKDKLGFDTLIKRVLHKDLLIDSKYNTYKNFGLPPYPICMPSISAIEAVLNYEKNDYIFMCAQPGYTGYHDFASSYAEHKQNASAYQKWLDEENIKR